MAPPTPQQVVPRPSTWQPGSPPPWAEVPDARRRAIGISRVLAALARRGQAGTAPAGLGLGHLLVAPRPVGPGEAAAITQVNAGVLVVLFEEGGEARLVLTRRSAGLRTHTGEVSFPGGRLDHGEAAPAAARREAHEEIGLDPSLVTLAGWLHPVLARRSDSLILPLVATVAGRPDLRANPEEVDRVFDVSLAELAQPETFHEERWPAEERDESGDDHTVRVWFFEVLNEVVWGATARIVHELLCVVLLDAAGE